MRRTLRLRLRAQILLTLTSLLLVSLLVIYFVVRGLNRTTLVRERLSGALEAAGLVAGLAQRLPVEAAERDAFVLALTARPNVRAALLVDAGLRVLAPAGMQPFWAPRDVSSLQQMVARGRPAYRYPHGPDAAELWVLAPAPGPPPLRPGDSPRGREDDDSLFAPPVAAVGLYFHTPEPVTQQVVSERLLLLFLAFIIGLLALVAHLALTRLVVGPVRRLIRTVDRVAVDGIEGIAARTDAAAGSELQVLSDAVDRMLERIRADKGQIEQQVERLREMNERLVRAQESLVRSEKLASVGQLAAGVAHEIGNPISIVLGYLEILRDSQPPRERQREYLVDMQEATDRVNQIIRDLLDFARPAKTEARVAEVRRVIDHSLKLLRPQKKFKQVQVTVEVVDPLGSPRDGLDPDLPPLCVYMNEGRLQQVLVNLLMNAADALDGQGAITVRAQDLGERVTVAVCDGGPGIPLAQQRRIFDPFYTTKDPGEGTGLGLAICYSLVTAFGGDIAVESEPGEGATFTVTLWKPEHAPPDSGRDPDSLNILEAFPARGPEGPAGAERRERPERKSESA
jgi:signal transduction histidine kinase